MANKSNFNLAFLSENAHESIDWYNSYKTASKKYKIWCMQTKGVRWSMLHDVLLKSIFRLLPKDVERQKKSYQNIFNYNLGDGFIGLLTNRIQLGKLSSEGKGMITDKSNINRILNRFIDAGILQKDNYNTKMEIDSNGRGNFCIKFKKSLLKFRDSFISLVESCNQSNNYNSILNKKNNTIEKASAKAETIKKTNNQKSVQNKTNILASEIFSCANKILYKNQIFDKSDIDYSIDCLNLVKDMVQKELCIENQKRLENYKQKNKKFLLLKTDTEREKFVHWYKRKNFINIDKVAFQIMLRALNIHARYLKKSDKKCYYPTIFFKEDYGFIKVVKFALEEYTNKQKKRIKPFSLIANKKISDAKYKLYLAKAKYGTDRAVYEYQKEKTIFDKWLGNCKASKASKLKAYENWNTLLVDL